MVLVGHCCGVIISAVAEEADERTREEGWDYYELPASHDAIVAKPADVATKLLRCALREGVVHDSAENSHG